MQGRTIATAVRDALVATTAERVPSNTSDRVNDEIRRHTRNDLWTHVNDGPESITRRIEELDREWDIERVLEANAATASLVGLVLGATVDRRFFALPGLVAAFLLQHAVQGWCPPLPVLRRFGVRTQTEIARERYALKAIRGDFTGVWKSDSGRDAHPVEEALRAVEL